MVQVLMCFPLREGRRRNGVTAIGKRAGTFAETDANTDTPTDTPTDTDGSRHRHGSRHGSRRRHGRRHGRSQRYKYHNLMKYLWGSFDFHSRHSSQRSPVSMASAYFCGDFVASRHTSSQSDTKSVLSQTVVLKRTWEAWKRNFACSRVAERGRRRSCRTTSAWIRSCSGSSADFYKVSSLRNTARMPRPWKTSGRPFCPVGAQVGTPEVEATEPRALPGGVGIPLFWRRRSCPWVRALPVHSDGTSGRRFARRAGSSLRQVNRTEKHICGPSEEVV